MKRIAVAVMIAVVAGLLSSSTSIAQVKIQIKKVQIIGKGVGNRLPTYLLNSPDVQKDLGLSEEQQKNLKKIFEDQRKAQTDLRKGKLQIKERIEKSNKIRKETNEEITKLLGKDKMKRLQQIQMQIAGPTRYAKDLEITKEQQSQIQEVRKSVFKDRKAIIQKNKGNAQAIRDEFAKLNEKVNKKILEVLTDDQKAEWEKMTGKPFKGKIGGGFGILRPGIAPIQRPNIQIRPVPLKKLQPKKLKVKPIQR